MNCPICGGDAKADTLEDRIMDEKDRETLREIADKLYSAYEDAANAATGYYPALEDDCIRQAFEYAREAAIELSHLLTPDH